MTKPPRSKNQNNIMNTPEDIDDKKKFLSYFSNKMKNKGEEVNSRNAGQGYNANSAYADKPYGKQEFLGADALGVPSSKYYQTNTQGSNRMEINNYKIPNNYNSSGRP
jgi:lambda repressor-like predicted transcriptional regulator